LIENANLFTELKSNLTYLSYLFFMTGKRDLVALISYMGW